MFRSDREKLRKLEIELHRVARLIELLLLRIGVKPATQILILGGNNMNPFSLLAGGLPISIQLVPLPSGSIFATPADLELTADDSDVVIAPDTSDPSGASFLISIPASTAAPSFNLDATGLAPNNDPTQPPVSVSGTVEVTVTPAAPPPPPPGTGATSIGFQLNASQPSAPAAPVTAAASLGGHAKAPAK